MVALDDNFDIARLLNIPIDEDDEKLSTGQMISLRFVIESDNILIDYGSAQQVIVAMVKQTEAQLLVIGTVARSGVSGAVLGNTCEKVLDDLSIDILTVN